MMDASLETIITDAIEMEVTAVPTPHWLVNAAAQDPDGIGDERTRFLLKLWINVNSSVEAFELRGVSFMTLAMSYDDSELYVVTGAGIRDWYKSAIGAWAGLASKWDARSIWRITEDGTRRLAFR